CGILRAGMAFRLQRLKRRLLPAAVRLLCPPPYRPLRPLDQRCQGARQLCKIMLVRYRPAAVAVVSHGTTLLEWSGDGTARMHRSPSLLCRSPWNFVIHVVGRARLCGRLRRRLVLIRKLVERLRYRRLRRLSRSDRRRHCLALAVPDSDLLRRGDTHPQRRHHLAAEVCHRREYDNDLADPRLHVVAEGGAERVPVGRIERPPELIVGEPEHRFALLLLSDLLRRNSLDLEFPFAGEI